MVLESHCRPAKVAAENDNLKSGKSAVRANASGVKCAHRRIEKAQQQSAAAYRAASNETMSGVIHYRRRAY